MLKRFAALICLIGFVVPFSFPAACGETVFSLRLAGVDNTQTAREVEGFSFDEAWFSADSAAYNHALALSSLGMAIAAFRDNSGSADETVREALNTLGFSGIQTEQYDETSENTIASALAMKKVSGAQGEYTIVLCAVCGGNYKDEWLGNFDVGTQGDYHAGFERAARTVTARVQMYLEENAVVQPRIWVTGYSRGAAVANLTAAFLDEQKIVPDENVYAYTFATPMTVLSAARGDHENIFNIVGPGDVVPNLPLAAWGFDRCGVTLSFPSSASGGEEYEALAQSVSRDISLYSDLSVTVDDTDTLPLLKTLLSALAAAAPTAQEYEDTCRQAIAKTFVGAELNEEETAQYTALMLKLQSALLLYSLRGGKKVSDAAALITSVGFMHMPAVYLSWMRVAQESQMTPVSGNLPNESGSETQKLGCGAFINEKIGENCAKFSETLDAANQNLVQ